MSRAQGKPKVIQVRDVPDEVHDALQAAARHNADVVARARARGPAAVDRATILAELSAGREG